LSFVPDGGVGGVGDPVPVSALSWALEPGGDDVGHVALALPE
jgi:hypothetical protein